MRFILPILALLAGTIAPSRPYADQSAIAAPKDDVLLVRVGRLFTGTEWLPSRTLVIRNGTIESIAPFDLAAPPGAEEVLLPDAWALPGLVLADSVDLAPNPAPTEAITPTVLAGESFDASAPRRVLVQNGILCAYFSPGRSRLMPGQGAFSAIHFDGAVQALLSPSGLHAVMSQEALNPPGLYRPPVPPGPDNPILPAERQFPTVRAGALVALTELFQRALEVKAGRASEVDPEREELSFGPLVEVIDRRRPLRVRAERVAEIRSAMTLAETFNLRLVIEGGTEAHHLANELSRVGASVVLCSGVAPDSRLEPTSPFPPERGEADPDTAAKLLAARVPVALVPPPGGSPTDLLWYAAQSLSKGFRDIDVLRAITQGAAEAIGAESEHGVIGSGRKADILLFSTSPLDPAARPTIVIQAGKVVVDRRKSEPKTIAIRAQKIYTSDGAPLENATILVEGGKVVALGRQVSIPPTAEVVSVGTVVPGFIDSGGQVGLRSLRDAGDGEVAKGAPLGGLGLDQRLSSFFDPAFPDVLAAAKSGVTTIALAPAGGKPTAGLVSIVKTGASEGKPRIVREIAGLLLEATNAAYNIDDEDRVRKQFEAGKKYADSFEKYEKDLAAWKKKNPEKAREETSRTVPKLEFQAARDPIVGTWEGLARGDVLPGGKVKVEVFIAREDQVLKATIRIRELVEEAIPAEVQVEGGTVRATLEVSSVKIKVEGRLLRDHLEGTFEVLGEDQRGTFSVKRTSLEIKKDVEAPKSDAGEAKSDPKDPKAEAKVESKSDSKTESKPDAKAESKPDAKAESKADTKSETKAEDDRPKAPKKNASLEPYREILKGELPVFLSVRNERAARALLNVLRNEFEVRTVLWSPEHVPDVLDFMDELGVALSPQGTATREEDGKLIQPILLALRRRLPVILRSGAGGDARSLYATAAHAVRCGADPEDALRMITKWSALVLGIHDLVGTIEKGKEADLVILNGDPFQPGTRIERVMIDGRFVTERKSP